MNSELLGMIGTFSPTNTEWLNRVLVRLISKLHNEIHVLIAIKIVRSNSFLKSSFFMPLFRYVRCNKSPKGAY